MSRETVVGDGGMEPLVLSSAAGTLQMASEQWLGRASNGDETADPYAEVGIESLVVAAAGERRNWQTDTALETLSPAGPPH